MRSTLFAVPPVLLTLSLAAGHATGGGTSPGPRDAAELYAEHCARCHGDNGDGKGTAELDRPARSFLDGGYSYGNTENAVRRSIRHGIPGTPMPSFPDLANDEVAALARFVIDLGPEGTVTAPGASVLTVEDQPLVVHGMMPALGEGARREPRSVVVGFPNGTTFQYRGPDMDLIATFVGDFLDRADWGGRGGAALKPLGTVAWTPTDASRAAAAVRGADDRALRRKLIAVSALGEDLVRVDFDMLDRAGKRAGGGHEFIGFMDVEGVPVPLRTVVIAGTGARFSPLDPADEVTVLGGFGAAPLKVHRAGDGTFACDLPGVAGLRILIHARTFTDATGDALMSSIVSGDSNR